LALFCKLADPENYRACALDLSLADAERRHYAAFFKRHLELHLSLAADAGNEDTRDPASLKKSIDACRVRFGEIFDDIAANPSRHGRVTILSMARQRDRCLREFSFLDPFAAMKRRENERALKLLPSICRELDSLPADEQFSAIIRGVFAGNIFDMGAETTASRYRDASPDFFAIRKNLPPRPWLLDDLDQLADRLLNGQPYRKAVYFVDNAGSDFLLGAVPMMRWLAQRGTRVVLAANEQPTLNDITVHEVNRLWPAIMETEPTITSLPIDIVSTGTGDPLIDLSEVSQELNRAAADADLVVLEGMGRAVESNLDARLTCDTLNIAMIKDEIVAAQLGGKLFDLVCRFR
jgi:type II pantothenate kinase